jgi:malonate-semialdehyde dehydrogenase (acetylating)/methylmalonate-semialdehyde dehydrogenase
MTTIHHYVGGKAVAGTSGRQGDVFNPATGERTGRVDLASRAEVDAAVKTAKAALAKWAATPPVVRARAMFRFKELCERNADELVRMISAEHGKVQSDA